MWDPESKFGRRVEERLADETVIWLVTTSADGTPQPSPVWFLREGETLLIYSKPDTPKVRNIRARPQVALHFNTDPGGDDVIIFTGTAALEPGAPPAHAHEAYLAKYGPHIPNIGMTPEAFAQSYAQPIRVRLEKVRGW